MRRISFTVFVGAFAAAIVMVMIQMFPVFAGSDARQMGAVGTTAQAAPNA